jgi:hypothetical protein
MSVMLAQKNQKKNKNCEFLKMKKKAFQEGAEYGYNKANEWHYPSKGELPDVMQEVIICLKDEKIITRAIRINSDLWTSPTNDYFSREIIAWKEIVLPEEMKICLT